MSKGPWGLNHLTTEELYNYCWKREYFLGHQPDEFPAVTPFFFFFASHLKMIFRRGMGQIWWQEDPSEDQMQGPPSL